ncbi:MAG TPA: S8 family serine peptidase [Ideonella sp.]|nr:S8 family serine peptidase [Ideonella sp.]
MTTLQRLARLALIALTALTAWAAGLSDARAGQGLIVRLKDAPAHALQREQALALSATRVAGQRLLASRWQAVLKGSGLVAEAGLRLQPVGQASHLLLPGRTLSAAELARWRSALLARPEVAWVVLDERERRLQADWPRPADPLFGGLEQQWWLQPPGGSNANAIDARLRGVAGFQRAWSRTTGSAEVVIAVLDSGLTPHPDLGAARVLPGYDFVSDWDSATGRGYANDGDGRDADPADPGDWVSAADRAADAARYASCALEDSSWHGTNVAGMMVAASNNGVGVAGIDWAARLLPVRVAGKCGASVRDIVDGMRWAAGLAVCQRYTETLDPSAGCAQWAPANAHPARVINISFGGAAACNAEYQSTIDELWARGVVVVAAAGNEHGAPTRPASCSHVIGVTALNRDGFKASYANFGASVAIATVGGDDAGGTWGSLLADSGLLTLNNQGLAAPGLAAYAHHFGTSYATPIVSGTIGLMLAAHPGLAAEQIRAGLAASARPHVQSPRMAVCSSANPGRCLCSTGTCGAGILDAEQAVAYAQALAGAQAYQAPNWAIEQIDTAELASAVALGPDREAAAGATPPSSGSGASSGGSTGGGGSGPWLLALMALALAALAAVPRRASASRPG